MSDHSSSDIEFPPYIKEYVEEDVFVCWYHPNFCQNRYPPGQKKSNACTLICVLLAQQLSKTSCIIHDIETNSKLNYLITKAIVKGNEVHARLLDNDLITHPCLTIEEALKFGDELNILKEWEFEVFFDESIKVNLYTNINNFLKRWNSNPLSPNLYMLLITCNRTVLFIFQKQNEQIIFFDSHDHNITNSKLPIERGLVLAQTNFAQLKDLCDWYLNVILHNICDGEVDQYELAFLYKDRKTKSKTPSNSCKCGQRRYS